MVISQTKNILKRILFSSFTFIAFLFLTNTYYVIPFFIVKSFSLGQQTIKKLSIEKDGCFSIGKNTNNNCSINGYTLIWRLGETLVVEKLISKKDNGHNIYSKISYSK